MARRHRDEDLDSEFEYSSEKKRKLWTDDPLAFQKPAHAPSSSSLHATTVPSKQLVTSERDKEEWRTRRFHLLSMDAYSRHKAIMNQYVLSSGKGIEHFVRSTENDRNDYSVLREQHRFLWGDAEAASTWEERLARAYYDRLFKEYAIGDLSRYKENAYAMRWRTEMEVMEGKGQFVCGAKRCPERDGLASWEVNFAYVEQGERKNALVKLRLCSACSKKLNYHHKRKQWKKSSRSDEVSSTDLDDGKASSSSKHKKHKHSRRERGKDRKKREVKYEWKERTSAAGESESASSEESDKETASSKASAVWSKPAEAFLEKSQETEFEDYFTDMLL